MRKFFVLALVSLQLGIVSGGVGVLGSSTNSLAADGDVKALIGSSHVVALGNNGAVYTWGALVPGPTGAGSKDSLAQPTLVALPGSRQAVDVAATTNASVAVATDGSVWAWGTLGLGLGDADGTTSSRYLAPVRVAFSSGIQIQKVSGACESFLALDSNGEVWQWGYFYGSWSQSFAQPRKLEGVTEATSVVRGCNTSFAILSDGTAKAWGSNGGGKLGDGTTVDRNTPVSVSLPGSRRISSLSVSSSHTLAMASDGSLWGWGGNSRGELGADANAVEYSKVPRQITLTAGTGTIVSVAASDNSPGSVVVTSTNQIWEWGTWGTNGYVQNRRTLPANIGSTSLRSVVIGSGAAIYAGTDGSLWARGGWGTADLDGNCGASASDYPIWLNGQTIPARSLVRVRSNGQFGSESKEDRLSFARIDSGSGGSLPMDGSGTVAGTVGTELSVVGTSPASSCYAVADLSYAFSANGGTSWLTNGITSSVNSFGQTVVTVAHTPSSSGRTRGLLKVMNPDGQSESYRFWLGVSPALSSAPTQGETSALPFIVAGRYSDRRASVGIGADGLLYAWGDAEPITGEAEIQKTPKKLTTPSGITFSDASLGLSASAAVAAAVGSNGKVYVWGTGSDDKFQGGSATNALPTALDMPIGFNAKKVKVLAVSIPPAPGCTSSCTSSSGFMGIVLATNGTALAWGGGGSTTSGYSYGRGESIVVESSLSGFSFDELDEISGPSGANLALHTLGNDIYRWSPVRSQVSCSVGPCTYSTAAPTLIAEATKKIAQMSYSERIFWKADNSLVVMNCETYSSNPCTSPSTISVPGSRVVADIAYNLGQLIVLATDGTLWTTWSKSQGFSRINTTSELGAISRFAGPQGSYVISSGGAVWRTPSQWGPGSAPSGTCATAEDANSGGSNGEHRVMSTSAREFGPQWSEDSFVLGVDSPRVPTTVDAWGNLVYIPSMGIGLANGSITVRPNASTDLYAYFTSHCVGTTALSAEWDLNDDGTFETTSSVSDVAAGTTSLSTPRPRRNADEQDYEGLGSDYQQAKVVVTDSSPGGALSSGGGRFVGLKLTSSYGYETYRFAIVTRPEKPTGRVGVSINSAARFTDSADVNLSMVWPEGATTAIISNDGSFSDAQEIPVASSVRWRLPSEGTGYLPATVYVRFKNLQQNGSGSWDSGEGDINYTDDIVLDLSPPDVSSVTATTTSSASVSSFSEVRVNAVVPKATVTLSAYDGASGIAAMQVTTDPAIPGPERVFSRQITIPIDRGNIAVRVKDNVGLWSSWSFARVSGFSVVPETPASPVVPGEPARVVPTPPSTSPIAGTPRDIQTPTVEAGNLGSPLEAPKQVTGAAPYSASTPSFKAGTSLPANITVVGSKVMTSAKTPASSPVLSVKTTQAIRPTISVTSKNTVASASVTIGGKKIDLGSLKSNAKGQVTLPKMQIKAPGVYLISVKAAGKTTYIKIKVK